MLIKICGITRIEDARAAVEAGADAVGFIFWPRSPRFVDPYRARAIAAALPPMVGTVGVFVDQPAEYVQGVASLVPLSTIQLHGAESPAFAAALRRPVLKAITARDAGAAQQWSRHVMLLIDAEDPVRRGGTGRTADWTAAASLAAARPVLLAGGLTPDNVAEAITQVRPFGIDVSSGVERAPGIKDHDRLRALIQAARAA